MVISKVQLGKNGITENFIETLKNGFKKHKCINVSVLKSAGHDRAVIDKYSRELISKLGKNFSARTIGFVIKLKKWRKEREQKHL